MLIRRKISGVICQRLLDTVEHAIKIVFMAFVIINLQVHAIPFFLFHLVAGRQEGIEIEYLTIHFVMEIMSSVLCPFALKIARGNGSLIGRSAYRGLEGNKVSIVRNTVELICRRIGN